MRNKGLAVQPTLAVTENRAKWCQISGRSHSMHARSERGNPAPLELPPVAGQEECSPMGSKRLASWKELAGYMHCTIRSVQRWERGEGLPVHRHLHQRGSTVYAYSGELDAWLEARRSDAASNVTAPGLSDTRVRIHVLPFVYLGNDEQFRLLCDGLTEEIIFQLASLDPQQFAVVARATPMSQDIPSKTNPEIGRSLGVTSVVEGCLRSLGRRIRLTARLIRVSDQTQVWTGCFDGEVSDPLQSQMEIARQVVQSLHCPGLMSETNSPPQLETVLPSQNSKRFEPVKNETEESRSKHRRKNSQDPKGTLYEPGGKQAPSEFVTVLRPPKVLSKQETALNLPC
jgi:TolB-like protein